jgi:hypothetical protein
MHFPDFSEATFSYDMIVGKTIGTVLNNFVDMFCLLVLVLRLSLYLVIGVIS